jgi:hypothetical protein
MLRRSFLISAATAAALAQNQEQEKDTVVARPTMDRTPRVGIVLSSFTGSQDHDGTIVKGLADPAPVDAALNDRQIDAMVRMAMSLGARRMGSLEGPANEDWVVIRPRIETCFGLEGGIHHRYLRGSVTDLRVVRSVISYLVDQKRGARFTIAEGSGEWQPRDRSKAAADGWTTDWGGEFGGLSYQKLVDELSKAHPGIVFDLVDLNFDEPIPLPLHHKALARNNAGGSYFVPKTIQQCDRLITVGPLATQDSTGVSLSLAGYWNIAPGAKYGFPKDGLLKLGTPDEVVIDLFSYRPADYAVLGGCWGLEGGWPSDPGVRSVHHNVIVAGTDALSVDATGAALMGFDPAEIRHLQLAEQRGFGETMPDLIWTRGNQVDQARRVFRKPPAWKPSKPDSARLSAT